MALAALEKIALRGNSKTLPLIGEVVLAHPDVDQDHFRQLVGAVKSIGASMTLYTSQSDVALWASSSCGVLRAPEVHILCFPASILLTLLGSARVT